MALSSASNELRTATEALLQQLRADHTEAAALCRKVGLRSCKELREAKKVNRANIGLSVLSRTAHRDAGPSEQCQQMKAIASMADDCTCKLHAHAYVCMHVHVHLP